MEIVKKAIVEILKPWALGFLSEVRFSEKMDARTACL